MKARKPYTVGTKVVYRILILRDEEPYEIGDAEDADEVNEAIELHGTWGFIIEQRQERGEFHTDWEDVDSCWGFIGWENCQQAAIFELPDNVTFTLGEER